MTKLQITIPSEQADLLSMRAKRLGLSLARFVKHLIYQESLDISQNIPTYKMSAKAEKIALEALKEHQAGKTQLIENLDALEKI